MLIRKNFALIIIATLVLFFVYNDYTQVEHDHAYFTYYDNMSHFSMYVFLNPFWNHSILLNKLLPSVGLFVLSLIGLKLHLEVFLTGLVYLLIKIKVILQLIDGIIRKVHFELTEHFSKLFLFAQTEQAILPFI